MATKSHNLLSPTKYITSYDVIYRFAAANPVSENEIECERRKARVPRFFEK